MPRSSGILAQIAPEKGAQISRNTQTQSAAYLVASVYNLLRVARLTAAEAT